ncbi:hypothetical protein FMUND_12586 [Fusarium mundagurra]|uniref:C2H2-type domain-containing protein n=1 Tax=Fusarium mundagurra TaxID=1567541 RepID=A0A8H6D6F4_9HYPO|nr:hypothetical protein FMUND_12586 [Fusarium mundagurra]
MEHRPLPHHSPAIRRYLNEPACLYGRLWASNGSDRDQFYVDSHKSQLRTVQKDVSCREPSQANRFPFLCVFHFAGCDQKFENKRDWKDHVVSQHLKPERVFWECTEGDCAHSRDTLEQCKSLQTNCPSDEDEIWLHDAAGRHFTNKPDFRNHLLGHHQSIKPNTEGRDIIFLPDTKNQWLMDRQDSSMRMVRGLPQDLGCPMPQCASVRFTGPMTWDQRLNHAAEHFITSPQCLDVFGGEKDTELVRWASSGEVGIHKMPPNSCLRTHDCDKSVADSGYSSMPGMPRQPALSQQGDSSTVLPSKMRESTSDATFSNRSTEALWLGAGSVGIGFLAQDRECLEPILDQGSISSAFQSLQHQYESTEDEGTADTSQGSSIPNGMPPGNAATAAARSWFHGWLREWLAPLTRERPNGNGNSQSTDSASTSQTRNSGSGSSANTSKQKKTTNRPRPVPKRKRDNDDEGDNNEKSPKSRHAQNTSGTLRLACPYFKGNPRKYSQPHWKACAHPGFLTIHRMKEHLVRNHSPPKYQCQRCGSDLKTSEALRTHSKQTQACEPCPSTQDRDILNEDQLDRLRSKNRMGQNKSQSEKWTEVYKIVFPNDRVPSPYLEDTEQDKIIRDVNLCQDIGRYLEAKLELRMEKLLTTVEWPLPEWPLPEWIQQYIIQGTKGFVPQLLGSYLKEMGYVTSDESGEQLDNASATTGSNADDLSMALQQGSAMLGTSEMTSWDLDQFAQDLGLDLEPWYGGINPS